MISYTLEDHSPVARRHLGRSSDIGLVVPVQSDFHRGSWTTDNLPVPSSPCLSFPPISCRAFSWPDQTDGHKAWESVMFSIWVLIMEQKGSTGIFRINWDEQAKGTESGVPANSHAVLCLCVHAPILSRLRGVLLSARPHL